jgi:hypothetical protein
MIRQKRYAAKIKYSKSKMARICAVVQYHLTEKRIRVVEARCHKRKRIKHFVAILHRSIRQNQSVVSISWLKKKGTVLKDIDVVAKI